MHAQIGSRIDCCGSCDVFGDDDSGPSAAAPLWFASAVKIFYVAFCWCVVFILAGINYFRGKIE
jgi:hypothetical protein